MLEAALIVLLLPFCIYTSFLIDKIKKGH